MRRFHIRHPRTGGDPDKLPQLLGRELERWLLVDVSWVPASAGMTFQGGEVAGFRDDSEGRITYVFASQFEAETIHV
jgi:hypothetical protein